MTEVRVTLPVHLQTLARVEGEVRVAVAEVPTASSVLDALETEYPMLRGTIRDHGGGKRRAYMRYYAAGNDISHEPPDSPLPEEVTSGKDVFCVIGAISGG